LEIFVSYTGTDLVALIAEVQALLADTQEVAKDGRLMGAELSRSIAGIVDTQTDAILGRVAELSARLDAIKAKCAA
jgi:hypothetical protein